MSQDETADNQSGERTSRRGYSDEELLQYIRDVAQEVEGSPTMSEFDELGPCSPVTCQKRFGTWGDALKEAGFEPNVRHDITEEELIEELQNLAEKCGHTPSNILMREDGPFHSNTYERHFGSWNDALREAGLDVQLPRDIDKSDLVEEFHRLADEVGRAPKQDEMSELGGYTIDPYIARWGTWNNVIEDLGYEANFTPNIPREELLSALSDLADEVDRTPTAGECQTQCRYSLKAYQTEFGTWNEALRAAGLEINRQATVTDIELIRHLRWFANQQGGVPTVPLMDEEGPHGATTYVVRFGSWPEALLAAGLDPERLPQVTTDTWDGRYYGPNWKEQRRKARERDNYRCQDCGDTNEEHLDEYGASLPVHHRQKFISFAPFESRADYEEANALSNLITFCHICHGKWEDLPVQPPAPVQ